MYTSLEMTHSYEIAFLFLVAKSSYIKSVYMETRIECELWITIESNPFHLCFEWNVKPMDEWIS